MIIFSLASADAEKKVVANLIHASADKADAEREILVWFRADEIFEYETIYQAHTM